VATSDLFAWDRPIGRLVRLPLRFMPRQAAVPVLSGINRGRRWVVGASTHGCWLGTYEADHQRQLQRLVARGAVAYDIGANVGFYTLALCRLVGPGGRVFSFEPNPANAALLRRHLAINRVANVEVVQAAAWETSGTVRFDGAEATGHVDLERGIEVSALALDDFVARGHPVPSFVKMDVEGGEMRALSGATGILRERRTNWLVSTHSAALFAECRALFLKHGYAVDATLLAGMHPTAPDFIAIPR
jgi:FkbM family methyltransferase